LYVKIQGKGGIALKMDAKQYWESRYALGGNSGYGSYGEQLIKKLRWLDDLTVESIAEIGCGDFNFGKHLLELYPQATYTGYDISKTIIEKNKQAYPQYMFTSDPNVPEVDLLLCVDVLFHVLDDNQYENLLNDLKTRWRKYLAITAYENEHDTSEHVKTRKFDYKQFGEPIIREIVEEEGQLYFYLFKKPFIDLRKASCILLTKEKTYPPEILDNIKQYQFGEVLVGLDSPSPFKKHELFKRAKYDHIYYQDDDAICPIKELAAQSKPNMINVVMKPGHFDAYSDTRMTMGLGWGAIFPKSMLASLSKYTDKYGEDEVYQRETERILTYLNYPQNRLVFPITDLPSAYDEDRLWRQPHHNEFAQLVEERCKTLV
jgi:hypothetical protein